MMFRPVALSMIAILLGSASFAQDEPDTSLPDDTTLPCEAWDVGFVYEDCDRTPWPGAEGGYQQVYLTETGERRSFRFDPQASRLASPDARADNPAVTGDARIRSAIPSTIAEQIAARKAQDAATDAAPAQPQDDHPRRRRSGVDDEGAPIAAPSSSTPSEHSEGASAPPAADSASPSSAPSSADVSAAISRRSASTQSLPSSRASREPEPNSDEQAETKAPEVASNFVLPNAITILPGRTELLPMAVGHLNRLETPFSDPMVRTSAAADALTVEFDQNFVYIALSQAATLFIHERGHPDPAIVVALIPQQIAPRQVKFNVPATMAAQIKKQAPKPQAAASTKAKGPKANTAGVTREAPANLGTRSAKAVSDLRTFSEGRMPRGFQYGSISNFAPASFCTGPRNVTFSFAEGAMIYDGVNFIVRGMVTTTSKTPIDLQDQWCMKYPGSLAAGYLPRTQIAANNPTDFYVIVTRSENVTSVPVQGGGNDG